MFRRSVVLALVLMVFGSGVGVAVAALLPQSIRPITVARPPARPAERTEQLPEMVAPEVESDPPVADEPQEPSSDADLAAVQQRLTALKYYVGPVDGSQGAATHSALLAFQKVNGLSADGILGPATLRALDAPVAPALHGGAARRVEVNLDKQVLYYIEGGRLSRILPVSSGNGSSYEREDGGQARSLTPVGSFTVQRKTSGVREADLGTLYDPMYFYQGWAIHGSNYVPAYPASHGCVRVSRSDALWLFRRLSVGTPVLIYGGRHTFVPGSSAPGTMTPAGDGPINETAVESDAEQDPEEIPEEDLEQPEDEHAVQDADTDEEPRTRIVRGKDEERLHILFHGE